MSSSPCEIDYPTEKWRRDHRRDVDSAEIATCCTATDIVVFRERVPTEQNKGEKEEEGRREKMSAG